MVLQSASGRQPREPGPDDNDIDVAVTALRRLGRCR
jgi:hypothetical protein